MTYKLSFTHKAEKDLAKLPKKDAVTILEHCILLEAGEKVPNTKKLHPPLKGYRLRVGRYRILYVYEDSVNITIHTVKHRKDVYK